VSIKANSCSTLATIRRCPHECFIGASPLLEHVLHVRSIFLEILQAALGDEPAALLDIGFAAFPAGVDCPVDGFVLQCIAARAAHRHVVLVALGPSGNGP
jgi:hypothetical protein